MGEVERSEGGGGRDQAEVGDRVVGQVQVLLKIIRYIWTYLDMFGNMDICIYEYILSRVLLKRFRLIFQDSENLGQSLI